MIICLIIGIIITGIIVRLGTTNGSFDEIDFDNIKNQIAGIIVIVFNIVVWSVTIITNIYYINKNR